MFEAIMYASFFCCVGFGVWCALDEAKLMFQEFRHA